MALTCKYTRFRNHQNKKPTIWDYLTDTKKNSNSLPWNITPQNNEPDNKLDHYVNTLQRSNEDYDPGTNGMFLNNLNPTCYAMEKQNPEVLTHTQMKRQVDANKFIDAQIPEIEGLMDINTFEFIPKTKLPANTRFIDLIWTYR
jgi:hypothetical protein